MNSRAQDAEHEEDEGSVVRPFMLTRGRTRSKIEVSMESLIDRLALSEAEFAKLDPAKRDIWQTLSERKSAAELSALLHLPLGIVLVLLGDMADQENIQVHQTASTGDVDLVRRLIDGVRSL